METESVGKVIVSAKIENVIEWRRIYVRYVLMLEGVVHGPGAQNRSGVTDFQAHLRGRIAYVRRLNLERGERLRRLFERIEW
jgi:hypothetical protein